MFVEHYQHSCNSWVENQSGSEAENQSGSQDDALADNNNNSNLGSNGWASLDLVLEVPVRSSLAFL
jgi:hypothetical protein